MTIAALISAACGAVSGLSKEDFARGGSSSIGSSGGSGDSGNQSTTAGSSFTGETGGSQTGGSNQATGGSGPATGGSASHSGGSGPATGGSASHSGGSGPAAGGTGPTAGMGGWGGVVSIGGSGTATGSSAGSGTAGSGGAIAPAYAPRTGSFKMLAYSVSKGYRHDSIEAGQTMLQDIGREQGFEVITADTIPTDPTKANEDITAAGLAQYEIVFFMNSSGDVFNDAEQTAFEDWITAKNGAFGGVHAATDTENGWSFYQEMTGQYHDGHDSCCAQASIQWQSEALNFIAVDGLPNPWVRSEEWFRFRTYQDWSSKAGFKILSLVTTPAGATWPVSYIREWGNFRSFYTSLGHEPITFRDVNVKKHIAAGIMWAVRREALLKTN